MCGAKFTRTKRATSYYRDHCHPKDYTAAFADFKYIFKKKTGIEWDMRLERIKTDETFFVYTPPVLGRPVGDLPDGYIRPEERDPVVEYSQNEMEEDMEKSVAYDTNSEVDDSDAEDKSSSTQERSSSDTLFSGSSSSSSQNASPCKGIPFRSSSHSSHSSSSGAVSPRRPLPPCRATSISSDEGDESQ